MIDCKWGPQDGHVVPEVVSWLRSLTHENLVDLWLMLNEEMLDRGFPNAVDLKNLTLSAKNLKDGELIAAFCRRQ